MATVVRGSNESTFVKNMSLPIHRWYRFPAGFSAGWVSKIINEEKNNNESLVVLDPFAGSGTALLAGELAGITALGIEAQPFIKRIGSIKLMWNVNISSFEAHCNKLLTKAASYNKKYSYDNYPSIIHRCYDVDALQQLDSLKRAWNELNDETMCSELTWLAITSVLRSCSSAGTAPWQYLLPNKKKVKKTLPFPAIEMQAKMMLQDMEYYQNNSSSKATLYLDDARKCSEINKKIDLVITSPPYANNYDYADATRLEMTFWGEIVGWGDLQEKVRRFLIRSCSQHTQAEKIKLNQIIDNPLIERIYDDIKKKCLELETKRNNYGGKKHYHTMIASYFIDLAEVWVSLRRLCKNGSKVCFVIGDSAPYSVYIPVDNWLGELALSAGFKNYRFEKIRDRNIKWDNRTHKVPLKEGLLWVEG